MADYKTHATVSAAVGVSAYLVDRWLLRRPITLGGIALSGLGGFTAGCIPDIIEPALHPNHRGFFHSVTAAGIVGYLGYRATDFDDLSDEVRLTIRVLSAGYGSHLILDAATPKSLPSFQR
ncbi:MAG TPA: metal-dependent hydrolase [Blastocatellia bacterium]|nr:metal-dependent hydrolase [Blastocatellia bacterium]